MTAMRRHPYLFITALSLVLHGYIAWRLLPALPLGPGGFAVGAGWLLASSLLTPAPLLIRLRNLPVRMANALAWTGYFAMGVFSTLLVLCVLRDLLLAVVLAWDFLQPGYLDSGQLRTTSALAVVALSLMVSLIGLVNARRLARVVDVELPIEDLPAALAGFTIVQLSDIHVGPTIRRGYVDAIVDRVNGLDADLIAITGDLIDGSVAQLGAEVAPLSRLRARHGTFCVTGNHEYYHGVDEWLAEWRRLGLRALLNANATLEHDGELVLIGGVTDYSAHHIDATHRSDAAAAARSRDAVAIKILLAHQPRSAAAAATAGFDVQLSGHTHGGQFAPWNFFVSMQQPFVAGLDRLHQLWVYTSRGTGYWGPPLRLFAPSEITRLRLVRAGRCRTGGAGWAPEVGMTGRLTGTVEREQGAWRTVKDGPVWPAT